MPSAFNERGLAWYHKGDPNAALADYNQALELDPKNASAYEQPRQYRKGARQ